MSENEESSIVREERGVTAVERTVADLKDDDDTFAIAFVDSTAGRDVSDVKEHRVRTSVSPSFTCRQLSVGHSKEVDV